MDFDQMMEAWKAQDERPLYGVNGDLLRLVLRNEQASIRRALRWDQWTTYAVGGVMAAVALASLWAFLHFRGLSLQAVLALSAGVGATAWASAIPGPVMTAAPASRAAPKMNVERMCTSDPPFCCSFGTAPAQRQTGDRVPTVCLDGVEPVSLKSDVRLSFNQQ